MAQLQSTNVTGVLCVNGVAVGGGKDFKFCCYTSTTAFTPSSDLVDGNGFVEADIVGGGGGGGAFGGWVYTQFYVSPTFNGGEGAAGGFRRELIDIDSTDVCTVTVGAKGDFGWVSGSWGNYCTATQYLSQNGPIQKGGDGGNSSFGGVIGYGGCGGYSVGCAAIGCCQQFAGSFPPISNCDAGVLTQAGAGGGFRNSFETETGGVLPLPGSGSEACLNNGNIGASKIGFQGNTIFKRCSTGPNCSSDSNCTPSITQISSGGKCCEFAKKYSQTYGNGGATNTLRICNACTVPCSLTTSALGATSGSDGDAGIVVIKWQE